MDGLKEFYEAMQERIKAPVYGSVFIAFLILNWKTVFVLVFTSIGYEEKFAYFDENKYWFTFYVAPILLGLVLVYITPRISTFFTKFVIAKPKFEKKIFEMNQAYDLKDAEEVRKATVQKSILDRSKKADEGIANLQDDDVKDGAKKDLKSQLPSYRVNPGEIKKSFNSDSVDELITLRDILETQLSTMRVDQSIPTSIHDFRGVQSDIANLNNRIMTKLSNP